MSIRAGIRADVAITPQQVHAVRPEVSRTTVERTFGFGLSGAWGKCIVAGRLPW